MRRVTKVSERVAEIKSAAGFDDDFYGGPAPGPVDWGWGDTGNSTPSDYEPSRQELQQDAHQRLKAEGYRGNFDQASRAAFKDHLDRRYIDAEDATRGHMLIPQSQRKGLDPRSLFQGPMANALFHASPELKEHWNQVGRPTYQGFREGLISGQGTKDNQDYTYQKVSAANPYAVHPALETVKNAWAAKSNAGPAPAPRNTVQSMAEADHYANSPHEPNNPAIQQSYKSLIGAIGGQYNDLKSQGISFTPHTGQGEPYANSDQMRADLSNGQLKYLPTSTAGELPAGHPMSQTINTADGPMLANDAFRAVHDALGHGFGAGFGPLGEQSAWMNHRQTLPPEAHQALWSETRGQNVQTNYGAHMRSADGNMLPKEQQPPLSARPFAEQKMVSAPQYA